MRAWREWYSPMGTMWKDELSGDTISDDEMTKRINNEMEND